ncbi:MAG: YheC/YheD family protein [Thermoanaerobacteraceae bacterium]|nr:YheC/YheD family protein [Thermoanaerobacteraceae bacterium]
MSKHLRIGVLSPSLESPHIENIIDNLETEVIIFTPRAINWRNKKVYGYLYSKGSRSKKACSFPAVVYNRCYTTKRKTVRKIAKHIGKNKIFNYTTKFDKWEVYQILQQSSLKHYLPATWLYQKQKVSSLLEEYKVLILKPSKGHFGENVYRLEKAGPEKYLLYGGSEWPILQRADYNHFLLDIETKTGSGTFILQQFIPLAHVHHSNFDLRLLLQKNDHGKWTVSAAMSRICMTNFWITNFSPQIRKAVDVLLEAGFKADRIMEELTTVSIKTAKILDRYLGLLGEISVDFGLDESGKPWIIEVNGMPTKNLFLHLEDPELQKRINLLPFQYAQYLIKR